MSSTIIFYIMRIPLNILIIDIYEIAKETPKKFAYFSAFFIDESIEGLENLNNLCPWFV
jgi:hypothetical protein